MKKYINGQYIDLTETEIAELETARKQYAEELKKTQPTETERLEAIETALLELAEVLANG